jgi:hypothetical protein
MIGHLAVYGRFEIWSGENAYGPRYLIPVLPLLVALVAPVIDSGREWLRGVKVAAVVGFLGPGLLGSIMYFNAVYWNNQTQVFHNLESEKPTARQMYLAYDFQPRSSPLMQEVRSVPDLFRNTADRLRGREGGLTPIPAAYEERIHWYARAIELDTWWAWWSARGDPAAGYLFFLAPAGAHPEDWDWAGLNEALHRQFELRLAPDVKDSEILSHAALVELVTTEVERVYREREAEIGPEMFHRLERWIMLGLEWEGGGFRGINQLWREHLLNMDHLKEGIGLRGYGQRDPLTEYKKEAFDIFQEMIEHLKEVVVEQLFKVRSTREEAAPVRTALASPPVRQSLWQESRGSSPDSLMPAAPAPTRSAVRTEPRTADGQKVGRNDLCPCGSGKKYKKCCLLKGA